MFTNLLVIGRSQSGSCYPTQVSKLQLTCESKATGTHLRRSPSTRMETRRAWNGKSLLGGRRGIRAIFHFVAILAAESKYRKNLPQLLELQLEQHPYPNEHFAAHPRRGKSLPAATMNTLLRTKLDFLKSDVKIPTKEISRKTFVKRLPIFQKRFRPLVSSCGLQQT